MASRHRAINDNAYVAHVTRIELSFERYCAADIRSHVMIQSMRSSWPCNCLADLSLDVISTQSKQDPPSCLPKTDGHQNKHQPRFHHTALLKVSRFSLHSPMWGNTRALLLHIDQKHTHRSASPPSIYSLVSSRHLACICTNTAQLYGGERYLERECVCVGVGGCETQRKNPYERKEIHQMTIKAAEPASTILPFTEVDNDNRINPLPVISSKQANMASMPLPSFQVRLSVVGKAFEIIEAMI